MAVVGPPLYVKPGQDAVAILASTTDSTAHTTNGSAVLLPRPANALSFELDVTAAAAAVGDTLDVFVQTLVDGTNWLDVVHFTQVLGNGGAKRYFGKIVTTNPVTMFENGTALNAAAIRDIFGDQWRVKYTIVDGGAHGQSFTFAVWALPC